jgi:hypothetical protein
LLCYLTAHLTLPPPSLFPWLLEPNERI